MISGQGGEALHGHDKKQVQRRNRGGFDCLPAWRLRKSNKP